jgi:hypothetical protein
MTSVTVSIWHNVARDQAGRHTAPLDGFTPRDPMVRVFTYQTQPRGRPPEAIAEDAFAAFNGHPRNDENARLSRRYDQRRLRSLTVADLVVVGETPLIVDRAGWVPLRGGITEVRLDEHGTHPPPPAADGQPGTRQGDHGT